MKENNTGIEREVKNKSKSERAPEKIERERGRNSQERRCGERAFGGYLVIGFIIQVHDFNFPLFLSKAGGAAGGRLVVSWITAYEMSCSAPVTMPGRHNRDGNVPRRTVTHSDFLFQPTKTHNHSLFTKTLL